ncbi:MAG TPA: hypothetical protein VNB90_14275 [Cytophagaceae bacterium]|jgi:hypothetical protein|nr:hypothetical protein [Cytophagaceae bacterium]
MKTLSISLCILLVTGFLFSCSGTKTQELISKSSDQKAQIKVSGFRAIAFDPFQATIIIDGFGQSDTLVTEIYAKDLSNETVKFDWVDEANCTLSFVQQDDSKRTMQVRFSEDGNSLREIQQ